MSISPEFLVNYFTGRRLITKVKVDRWISLVIFQEKIICKETIRVFLYMHSPRSCMDTCNQVGMALTNVDIKFNSHVAFSESPSWGTLNIERLINCLTMRSYELNYIDLKVNKHNPECQNIAEIISAFMEPWLIPTR